MITDMYPVPTKAELKAGAAQALRNTALDFAVRLSKPISTAAEVVADAAVIEKYLAGGVTPKKKRSTRA